MVFQAVVRGAFSVHGCGSVHAVVELREDVRDLHHLTGHYLGHASIVTTERYDNQQLERLQVAAARLESGKLFEAPACKSGTEFHISCTNGPTIEAARSLAESDDAGNSLADQMLEEWLGGRDSCRERRTA